MFSDFQKLILFCCVAIPAVFAAEILLVLTISRCDWSSGRLVLLISMNISGALLQPRIRLWLDMHPSQRLDLNRRHQEASS